MTKEEFTLEFEQIKPQLKSYILRISASLQDTEDIVQDTYIKALINLTTFRNESSVKTWIFAIASNLAKDHHRVKIRWPEKVTDICREEALSNPSFFAELGRVMESSSLASFEIKEHITLCLTCISKSLPLEQQICLLLKEVYEFKIHEIAMILKNSEAMIKYFLHTGRSKMVSIYEGRCALINKEGTCHQCSELNGIFNPRQNFEVEKNKIEFVKRAQDPDRDYLMDLRFKIMKEIDPYTSGGSNIQQAHLEHNRNVMENLSKKTD